MILLIVSRSERARAWMRRALDPAWEIDEASNGLEALKRARDEGDYDLVIADETTEPFGAFGLARELKILPEPPAVIVLLERTQDNWLAKWSGTDRWLTQPIDPFELVRTARELLAERQTRGPTDAGLGREDVAIAETAEAQTAGVERYPR
ncbi:MAG: response regulator transcription factor [Actinobacteria bacterium]|nr:MAG: response regulator transcription factor [Actinomycetota bacterium]